MERCRPAHNKVMGKIRKILRSPITEKIGIFLCGVVNGLFGGGGGMLLMPILLRKTDGVRRAHATAPAVMLPLSAVSAAVYLLRGETDWSLLWKCALGLCAGSLIGAALLKKVRPRLLSTVFALLTLAAALRGLLS
ncbi:MAG: sulfite exporter TauE/SafE family protein [Eubacteriales bacterium]|nr:sulfite exporter TauE/SafE family protein [Eubacteriales bacterium]